MDEEKADARTPGYYSWEVSPEEFDKMYKGLLPIINGEPNIHDLFHATTLSEEEAARLRDLSGDGPWTTGREVNRD